MVETRRANNVIRIPTSLQGKFFRIWIEFLTPLHNLTNREKDVVAAFIKALMTLSLQLPTKYSVACISLARGKDLIDKEIND